MECNIKIIKLKKVLPPGTYPKREYNVRYFYHRTDGCYYMYDEKGCETNLTTCGEIIPIDRELIVGSESLTDDTLVCIGLRANYVRSSANGIGCGCQDTFIKAWTYLKDLHDFFQTGHIERNYYRVTLTPAPEEGGIAGCSGASIVPDENQDGFRFQFESGSKVQLFAKPNDDYEFMGWKEYHTNEIISISPDWSFNIKKDIDLIAVFKKKEISLEEFYINLNAEPSTAGYVVGTGVFVKGTRHSILAAPIEGYHFVNWTNSAGEIISTDLQYDMIVEKEETLTAHFALDTTASYTVDVVNSPSEGGSTSGGGRYSAGQTALITPKPNPNYVVESVTSSDGNIVNNNNGTYSIIVNQNITVTVNFKKKQEPKVAITLKSDGINETRYKIGADGSWSNWSKSPNTVFEVDKNNSFSIEAKALETYEFAGFDHSASGNTLVNPKEFIATDNATITARFKEKAKLKFEVSAKVNPIGSATVNGTGEYTDGDSCTITVTPTDKYNIKQVLIDGNKVSLNDSNQYTFIVNKHIEVSVECEAKPVEPEPTPKYTVTVKTESGDKSQGTVGIDGDYINNTESITVDKNTSIEIGAEPAEGYSFIGWYKNNALFDSNAKYQFRVSENLTLVAKFKANTPTPTPSLEITPTELVFEALGGTKEIYVTSNVDWIVS